MRFYTEYVALFGLGYVGQRHAKNLLDLGYRLLIVTQYGQSFCHHLRGIYGDERVLQVAHRQSILEQSNLPLFGLICNGTSEHYSTALFLADLGVDLYVEKPLTGSWSDSASLIKLARKRNVIITTGYMLRHSQEVNLIKAFESNKNIETPCVARLEIGLDVDLWRNDPHRRDFYSHDKKKGGGALLDLSHEIDIAIEIWGLPKTVFARSVPLNIPSAKDNGISTEGAVELIFEYSDFFLVSIGLDMFRPTYRRHIDIKYADRFMSWNHENGDFLIANKKMSQDKITWDCQEVKCEPRNANSWNNFFVASIKIFADKLKSPSRTALVDEICDRELATAYLLHISEIACRSGTVIALDRMSSYVALQEP